MNRVLVVDDEKNIRETLKDVLEDEGYNVIITTNGRDALDILKVNDIDVVLLDLWLPEIGGMNVLKTIKEEYEDIQIIIISGHGTIDTAVKATKMGAFDFLEKPLSIDRVLNVINHAVKINKLRKENIELRKKSKTNYYVVRGISRAFKEIENLIESCANSDTRVLITGENGTGKEVVARCIQKKSKRKNGPFIPVNCAAIPYTLIESELFGHEKGAFTGAIFNKIGKFEIADKGTIFLDEIADMSLDAQSKVLRVLEEMQFERVGGVDPIHVDVRVIAATNKNLISEIKEGRFREDLYYRLNVVPIHIAPLRDRREDIPILIEYYLNLFAKENNKKRKSLSKDALRFLRDEYTWPGNIRELKNIIERLSILTRADIIDINDVKDSIPIQKSNFVFNYNEGLKKARLKFEKELIKKVLINNEFNITKAAKKLKVERSNLHKLIKKLGIEIERKKND